jgi:hypothetical protein
VLGLDALEPPEIVFCEVHRLWISSSESLEHPGVVEALSVTKLHVANPAAHGSAEQDSGPSEEDAGVEGSWIVSEFR